MTRGICYVVWGDAKHVARAILAAKSSPVPTCIITDAATVIPDGAFDHVVRVHWNGVEGFYRKTLALTRSPFDVTLYTDTDVKITGNIDLVFRGAEQHGFVCTFSPGQVFQWGDREFPHYNGGYFAWKGHRQDVAAAWVEQGKKFTPYDDEAAFSLALDSIGVNPFIVPTIFNMIVSGWVHPRPIRGWHSDNHPPQSHLVSVFDNPFERTVNAPTVRGVQSINEEAQ